MAEANVAAPPLEVHPDAVVDPDARIIPSVKGTRIVVGARSHVYAFAYIRAVGGMGDIIIGEDCDINPHCVLFAGNGIRIGNGALIAPHVNIMPMNHAFDRRDVPIREQRFQPSRGGVVIEEDVWVGSQCVLLDGTYIERGAIIAAGSVVRGRVNAYSIWAGMPARYLKDRP